MKTITEEEIIQTIKHRIESEYHKHEDLDWAEIAARKIYAVLWYSGIMKTPEEIMDCWKNKKPNLENNTKLSGNTIGRYHNRYCV